MKYILIPLFIIGMFISFTAALIAMLFFTQTVQTPQDLIRLVKGQPDSLRAFDEFRLKEDRLEELFQLAEEYRKRYEEQARLAETTQESLAVAHTRLRAVEDTVLAEKQRLGLISDSLRKVQEAENLKELAKFYAKIKPQVAAEILQQEGGLSDTTVARLMKHLPAAQMAKIMGNMNPDFAARITKLMQEASP